MSTEVDIPSLRILVIEDEAFMRRLVMRVLYELGAKHTYEAENGSDGLSQVKTLAGKLDLVICDLEMPVLNGLKFIEGLRKGVACKESSDVPVIILTGHSDEENIQKAVQLGIQGFLVKPISSLALEKRIKSAVGSSIIDPSKSAPK
jgi:two-component system, chemotaxis family, chemotaxis protein CheY